MKKIFLFSSMLLFSILIFSQSSSFVGLQGREDKKGNIHFEYRGRKMSVYTVKGSIDDRQFIDRILKNYQLGVVTKMYAIDNENDKALSADHIVWESEYHPFQSALVNKTAYLSSNSNNNIDLVVFESYNPRDSEIESSLVTAYFNDSLTPYINNKYIAPEINLAGKIITLDYSYYWNAPNVVGKGESDELAWSVFPTIEEAQADSKNRILRDKSSDLVVSIDEYLDLKFDGIPSVARVITYYPSGNKMPFDRYYIVEQVNGMYLSVEVTRTLDASLSRKLPPALKKLIDFDDGEGFTGWLTERDVIEIDRRQSYQPSRSYTETEYDFTPIIDVGLGMWLPLGKLHNMMGGGPSFHIYSSCRPLIGNFTLDFGTGFTYIAKKEKYSFGDVYIDSKYFIPILVRGKYQIGLGENLFLTPYIGGGIHLLDLGAEEDDFKYPLLGLAGASLRHKYFAIFFEYNYVNYNWKEYTESSFGKGSIRAGVAFHFN